MEKFWKLCGRVVDVDSTSEANKVAFRAILDVYPNIVNDFVRVKDVKVVVEKSMQEVGAIFKHLKELKGELTELKTQSTANDS